MEQVIKATSALRIFSSQGSCFSFKNNKKELKAKQIRLSDTEKAIYRK